MGDSSNHGPQVLPNPAGGNGRQTEIARWKNKLSEAQNDLHRKRDKPVLTSMGTKDALQT